MAIASGPAPLIASSATAASSAKAFAPRGGAAVARVGKGLFVFGGFRVVQDDGDPIEDDAPSMLNDGALLRPGDGRAARIAPAPFEHPLYRPEALTIGKVVVVIGTPCPRARYADDDSITCGQGPFTLEAAEYNVPKDTWRLIDVPVDLADMSFGIVDGLGTTRGTGVFEFGSVRWNPRVQFWIYSPKTSTWLQLPAPGVRAWHACLVGDRLVVVFSTYKPSEILDIPEDVRTGYGFLEGGPALAVLDLDADGPWRTTVPAPAVTYQFGPEMACLDEDSERAANGSVLLFYSLSDSAQGLRLYDLATDAWSTPVPAPSDPPFPSGNLVTTIWTGREVLFFVASKEPDLAYDPASESWRTLDKPPNDGVVFWDGSAVIGYIGYTFDGSPRITPKAFRYVP